MTDLFEQAAERRDLGIARSADHADRIIPDWSDQALTFVRHYALVHDEFMAEDVRSVSHALGLPQPPDARAWGHVMQRARRLGLIVPCGYAPAHSSNCSPKVRWHRT